MRILFLLCAALPVFAQSLANPIAAIVITNRELLSFTGVSGNLLPGETVPQPAGTAADTIQNAAFSSRSGAVKLANLLLVTDAAGVVQSTNPAPSGPALFSFAADGSLAWVYYPETSRLTSMTSGAVNLPSWGGSAIALGPASSSLPVLIQAGSQLWSLTFNPADGSVSNQIPIAGNAPAVWFEGGWLVTTPRGLSWVNGSEAREISFAAGVTALQVSGPHTVAVNGRWLLNAQWQLLEIPVTRRARPEVIR
jgi:hypothetical protein